MGGAMIGHFRRASLVLAVALLAAATGFNYRTALPGYRYSFPRDHFEHTDFRTEWWYYTGNLRSAEGKRFGFELVFFRQGQRRDPVENRSVWRIDDVYLAHLALTDIDGKRFFSLAGGRRFTGKRRPLHRQRDRLDGPRMVHPPARTVPSGLGLAQHSARRWARSDAAPAPYYGGGDRSALFRYLCGYARRGASS